MALLPDPEPGLVHETDRERARPVTFERVETQVARGAPAQPWEVMRELEQPLELGALLRGAEAVVVAVLLPAPLSIPVACSRARGRGEIHTSVHAGGIASASIRPSASSSVIGSPRASR
jgi:hypothetical protein